MSGKKKNSRRTAFKYSKELQRRIVRDIEEGKCTVREASREIGCSEQSIYNWLEHHSRHLKKERRLVVEDRSELYRTKELEERVKELEAALGRKEMEAAFFERIITEASRAYGEDLKKSFSDRPSSGSDDTGENTGSR
jgi:transposase-like protein